MLGLDDTLYKKYTNLIYEKVGIEFGQDQKNVLNNRLMPLLLANKINNFNDYYNLLFSDKSGKSMSSFIEKVTTNYTYFYREKSHFLFLRNSIFPLQEVNLTNGRSIDLRYWVAACSTGEEAYTIAMMLNDFFCRRTLCHASVLATDISRKGIDCAIQGLYRKSDVARLPKEFQEQYFTQHVTGLYQVKKEIKDMILFRVLNLIREKFPFKGSFDVIFLRNVMIYFDIATREKLINQLYNLLLPGGYLFVGQTEALQFKNHKFKQVFPSVYRKNAENEK